MGDGLVLAAFIDASIVSLHGLTEDLNLLRSGVQAVMSKYKNLKAKRK